MKTMRQWMLLAAMLLFGANASAQINIPGTSVSFQLDNNGDTVLPYLRIYVKDGYGSDLYELVYDRYVDQPYQSLREWSKGEGIPRNGGLGYEGIYTKPTDKHDYRFLMIYFKERRTAVEFRLETTRETYEEMEVKFKKILSSIK